MILIYALSDWKNVDADNNSIIFISKTTNIDVNIDFFLSNNFLPAK